MIPPLLPSFAAVGQSASGSVRANSAPPIDDTPVEKTGTVKHDIPAVNIVPPTPPAIETLRGNPSEHEMKAEELKEHMADVAEEAGDTKTTSEAEAAAPTDKPKEADAAAVAAAVMTV